MKNKDHLQESVRLVGLSTLWNMIHGAYDVKMPSLRLWYITQRVLVAFLETFRTRYDVPKRR